MTHADDCGCVCNHAGACTGCGVCWLEAYGQETQIRSLFGVPVPIQPIGWQGAAQHTCTPACDGLPPTGPLPHKDR